MIRDASISARFLYRAAVTGRSCIKLLQRYESNSFSRLPRQIRSRLRWYMHFAYYRCSLPLLKSRNSGVVLAVCTTHYYCGSRSGSTMNQIAKAMVRILRNRREIQFVVLDAIRSVFKFSLADALPQYLRSPWCLTRPRECFVSGCHAACTFVIMLV